MTEVCRSCKAPIQWAVTAGGKRIPIDRDMVVGGNLRLKRRSATSPPLAVIVPKADRIDGEWLYVSHFATCPYADQHRRPRCPT